MHKKSVSKRDGKGNKKMFKIEIKFIEKCQTVCIIYECIGIECYSGLLRTRQLSLHRQNGLLILGCSEPATTRKMIVLRGAVSKQTNTLCFYKRQREAAAAHVIHAKRLTV